MKRMNLRDVPEELYATLARHAAAKRMSLNTFVVDQLAEVAQVLEVADHLAAYQPPDGTGISLEDAAAAVRQGRESA